MNATVREITAERVPSPRHAFSPMLVLAGAAAMAVVIPFCFVGNASGHDFEFHLASWMDVARQWREGILYPRWAALANWGFGEPRFIFYPPASWMLGAALSFLLPWNMIPGAFIWLALAIAGVTMFILAREWLSNRDAMAAGVLFAMNPYQLLVVYWRSDFAELLASAFIPLAVLFAIRMASEPRRAAVPLALVTAAVWLSNAPAAVVVSYTIALTLVVLAAGDRRLGPLIYGGGALALGLALAAFYIVPAALEQPWVNISEVLAEGVRFSENFLFTRIADAEHTRFNFLVSRVAVEVIVATLAAMIASARWRRSQPRLSRVLVALVAVATILMFSMTSPVWVHVPKLAYVQFPWRWLLVLDVPFALSLAAAIGRLRGASQYAAWTLALAGLASTGFLLTRGNWWDAGGPASFHQQHFSTGMGYFGNDEYGPRDSDHYDLDQNAPLVSLRGAEQARVQVQQWEPTRKKFIVSSPRAVIAALRLDNYPAWRVEVNGELARPVSEPSGQMLVPLPAGSSQVQIAFMVTPDLLWGGGVSAFAVLGLVAGVLTSRRRTSC